MNINGFEFNLDEKTIKEITDSAVKNFAAAAATAAIFSLVTEILVNGVFAKKFTEIRIDGELPAQLLTLGGKDNPQAVYITNKKKSIHIAPALLYGLAAAAAAAYLGRTENKGKDFVIYDN